MIIINIYWLAVFFIIEGVRAFSPGHRLKVRHRVLPGSSNRPTLANNLP